ncbi:GNAT family N-acetyltransferase [Microtetraspora malaysiensis]|uniref:GNAT family N-acetyltransferase n=1 Tax=Microtetraspora malaysiensis TaxID=161358 RepID=UPI003D8E15F6
MDHPYRRHDGPATAALSAQITDLYRRCYAAPPWSETPEQIAAYPGRLADSMTRPGFTCWTTHDERERLTGVCYGWPTPTDLSGSRTHAMLIRALGADATADLVRGAFEVAELFVHPDAQGRGIGGGLLAAAVAGWPTAWLITSPQAPAARLYRRLGWRQMSELPADLYPHLPAAVFATSADQGGRG